MNFNHNLRAAGARYLETGDSFQFPLEAKNKIPKTN